MAPGFSASMKHRTWLPSSAQWLLALGCIFPGWTLRATEPFLQHNPGPRAKVMIAHDPEATDAFRPRPAKIQAMMNRAITALTQKPNVAEAWRSLVSTQDIVGLKVFSTPGPNSGTRPAIVAAVVTGLLAAGLPPKNIIIWDKQITPLRL